MGPILEIVIGRDTIFFAIRFTVSIFTSSIFFKISGGSITRLKTISCLAATSQRRNALSLPINKLAFNCALPLLISFSVIESELVFN